MSYLDYPEVGRQHFVAFAVHSRAKLGACNTRENNVHVHFSGDQVHKYKLSVDTERAGAAEAMVMFEFNPGSNCLLLRHCSNSRNLPHPPHVHWLVGYTHSFILSN